MHSPYTVLRIYGEANELERMVPALTRAAPDLSPKLARGGYVAVTLIGEGESDDAVEPVERLKRLEPTLRDALAAGCTAVADADFELPALPPKPDGCALRHDAIRISSILMAALGRLGVDFRVSVYRLYPTDDA